MKKNYYLCTRKLRKYHKKVRFGAIAQLVEHRTENPCVTGSNPVGTTIEKSSYRLL